MGIIINHNFGAEEGLAPVEGNEPRKMQEGSPVISLNKVNFRELSGLNRELKLPLSSSGPYSFNNFLDESGVEIFSKQRSNLTKSFYLLIDGTVCHIPQSHKLNLPIPTIFNALEQVWSSMVDIEMIYGFLKKGVTILKMNEMGIEEINIDLRDKMSQSLINLRSVKNFFRNEYFYMDKVVMELIKDYVDINLVIATTINNESHKRQISTREG